MKLLTITTFGLLGAFGLTACVEETAVAPRSPLTGRLSASTAASSGAAAAYVILGAGNALPKGLAEAVQTAGGALTGTAPQIGVAFAASGDAGFAARAAKIVGVSGVARDTVVQWVDPRESGVSLNADGIGDDETFFPIQWADAAVHAPEAWAAGARGAGARVAVVDGGMRTTHIDIRDNVDNVHSRSFVSGFAYNQDVGSFSHATHVAGIVAAEDNGVGTIGIAPRATIISVKVLHNGSGSFAAVIQGIVYAATPIAAGGAGADIINMSLGAIFPRQGADLTHLADAVGRATTYAYQQGVTVFAAAGNAALDFDHTANVIDLPAQSPHVLAIAATGPTGYGLGSTDLDGPAEYTDYGQSLVEFAAPGGDDRLFNTTVGNASCTRLLTLPCWVFDLVLSPGSMTSDNGYFFADGTSMATPAAAAVGALIIEKYGRIGPAGVAAVLRHSADDLGKPGNDDFYGLGRVNAFRAVQ